MTTTPKFVSSIGAAALMGFSRQRFSQLLAAESSRIPEPDGILNDLTPIWFVESILNHGISGEKNVDSK